MYLYSLQTYKSCPDANLPSWTAISVTSVKLFSVSDGSLFSFVMKSVTVAKHGEINICWLSLPNHV